MATQSNFFTFLSILVLIWFAQAVTEQKTSLKGVQIAQASNLKEIISNYSKLLVLFADKNCQNCEECSQIYAITNEQYPEAAFYSKIYLSADTRSVFQEYEVTDFPRILAFINGKQSPYHFQCLGSPNNMRKQMPKWINRLDNSLKEWGEEDNHEHQLIVPCDTEERKKMWKKIERSELWLDLYCGQPQFLGSNLAVVSEYGKSIEAWQLQNKNQTQTEQQIRKLIRAYKYKYVLHWNTAIAQEIFLHQQHAFVMIVNNESQSYRSFAAYEEVKQKWYENTEKYQPVLFAVSDLSRNTAETIKLKRYLTGITTSMKKDYPYPILAFIKAGQPVTKYLINPAEKTKDTLSAWMEAIHQHIILNKPYKEGEQVLLEWLNQSIDRKSKRQTKSDSDQDSYFDEDTGATYLKRQQEWQFLLSNQTKQPFFVYITWRYDYELQKHERDVVDWWESKDKHGVSPNSKIKLFVHQLHTLDLPFHPGLTIEFVPSLCFISTSKQVKMLPGVTNLQKIKQFFNLHLNQSSTRSRSQQH